MIQIKRAYEPQEVSDGYRVLVDRLWPRGESKVKEQLDCWLKEIAPSDELRKWFGHEPEKFPEFRKKYIEELKNNQEAISQLMKIVATHKIVTLVYAAKNQQDNNAVVLKEFMETQESFN
ncbi:DUF488 domain-containing protein [Enterococcus sp. LJL99]